MIFCSNLDPGLSFHGYEYIAKDNNPFRREIMIPLLYEKVSPD